MGHECEFVLVDDSSSDGTFDVIRSLAAEYPCVHGIRLMRNFGQHNGLMCAMNFAKGDYVLGMDDDLQTQPSQIFKLVDKITEGYDIVYGVYPESKNGRAKNFTSWVNKVTSRKLLGRPKGLRSSNFWIITNRVREEVVKSTSYNPYVDGLFYRTSHNIGNVEVEHHKRVYGHSGYTLKKLARLWLSYFNYSVLPLRIASGVGIVTSFVGLVACIVTVIRKVLNPDILMGWASTMSVILLLFGITLMVLGVIGEYLGEIAMNINGTPQFIIRDKVNL